MRIMFYINTINHGGAERVITNLANQLSKRGHDCILVTSFKTAWEYEINDNVHRVTLNDSYVQGSFIKRNLFLTNKLRDAVLKYNPSIAVSFMAEPNFRLLIACAGINVKKVISIRNAPEKEYPNLFFKIMAKTLFNFADGIVFQTEEAKAWFNEKIQRKSKIIFNQVDQCFYDSNFAGERRDIVTTGRLVSQKNHKLLINAFSKVVDFTNDRLFIYGDGILKHELHKQIEELGLENRVFLQGTISNVSETIKSAKLFVLSSDYEGMPNSLMEAMALGIPCISTDCSCGGPRLLLSDIDKRLLVKVGDIEDMAKSMKNLLLSEEELERIGKLLKKKSMEFSPEKVIFMWEEYLSLINNVIV